MEQSIISGVYKITNIKTNKFYIGASLNIYKSWHRHKTQYKNKFSRKYNKKLYVNMRLYGIENFRFEILEICSTDNVFHREKYFIEKYDAYNVGYNEKEAIVSLQTL